MRPETKHCLSDMMLAIERILEIVQSCEFSGFENDWLKQAAVERQFEILGEALTRIKKYEPNVFEAIANAELVVSFRNRLAHVYDQIDAEFLWAAAKNDIPELQLEIRRQLGT